MMLKLLYIVRKPFIKKNILIYKSYKQQTKTLKEKNLDLLATMRFYA